ncbi:copper-transporting ATPase PAA2, chloroplastic [Senna tora]|uniref:Copper-transporting ATPase PAA2, chloroplastic n=1 Tax=Senna tora TaxID=362788 RepID=A0A834SWC3_9FABA|nr:copper-transporting ATPase PAA2, chloroplastic [Senna tora]
MSAYLAYFLSKSFVLIYSSNSFFVGGEGLHNSYVKGVLTLGPGREYFVSLCNPVRSRVLMKILILLTAVSDLRFDGLRAFKKGSPNMNSLVGFGSVAAFIISSISLLNPGMAWDASFFHEPHAGHASWIQASSGMNELLLLANIRSPWTGKGHSGGSVVDESMLTGESLQL